MPRGGGGYSSRRVAARARQLALAFPAAWGGARRGAGRKRADPSGRARVAHIARPAHRASEPVHVTLRARIAVLRSEHVFPTVRLALSRAARRDVARFRVLQYSVQSEHIHLLVEASDKRSLTRGMQSLAIRVALYVNELLSRRGAFWADRWHGHALRTPREVRNAFAYVLANFRKHTAAPRAGIDPFSSAEWFDGWRTTTGVAPPFAVPRRFPIQGGAPIVSAPRSWLARIGWRRHGLIAIEEAPAPERRRHSNRARPCPR